MPLSLKKKKKDGISELSKLLYKLIINSFEHGCQNPDLDPKILQFYDPTCPKQFESFKELCDHSKLVGLYDSDNPK